MSENRFLGKEEGANVPDPSIVPYQLKYQSPFPACVLS